MALIHMGGLESAGGSLKIPFAESLCILERKMNIKTIAIEKPKSGEKSKALPIFIASDQLTPICDVFSGKVEKTIPTPIKEPISVCELEHGIPKYQVPKFQMIAPNNTAKTIAADCAGACDITASTGNKLAIFIATSKPRYEEKRTPAKFQAPDQTTAVIGFRLLV